MIQAQVKPLTNQDLMDINKDIYNEFWRKYRDCMTENDEAWERVKRDMSWLMEKYKYHPLVVHQLQDYLDQLEWRYTEGGKRHGMEDGD